MHAKEFRRKVRTVYPDREVKFEHTEVQNAAVIGVVPIVLRNDVYSDRVYVFLRGVPAGTASAIEEA